MLLTWRSREGIGTTGRAVSATPSIARQTLSLSGCLSLYACPGQDASNGSKIAEETNREWFLAESIPGSVDTPCNSQLLREQEGHGAGVHQHGYSG